MPWCQGSGNPEKFARFFFFRGGPLFFTPSHSQQRVYLTQHQDEAAVLALCLQHKGEDGYIESVHSARRAGVLGKLAKRALDTASLKTAMDRLKNGTEVRVCLGRR